jgi:hypothetical protein
LIATKLAGRLAAGSAGARRAGARGLARGRLLPGARSGLGAGPGRGAARAELQEQLGGPADVHRHVGGLRPQAEQLGRDLVEPETEGREAEASLGIGERRAPDLRPADLDLHALQADLGGVHDLAGDDAGLGGVGRRRRRRQQPAACGQQQDKGKAGPRSHRRLPRRAPAVSPRVRHAKRTSWWLVL